MKTYIGTDLIAVSRFASWLQHSPAQLRTIFSAYECKELSRRTATTHATQCTLVLTQFLASRFAVKEAFYKAVSQLLVANGTTDTSFTFKACAPHIWASTSGTWHVPQLVIDRAGFTAATGVTLPTFTAQVSLAHEKECAIAVVLLVITT